MASSGTVVEYYTYIHCRPDGTPFYVGKGHGRRANDLSTRSAWHKSVVAKYGSENIHVGLMSCSSQENAYLLERGIIKCLRRAGVSLVNMTEGGDGTAYWTGKKRSSESIEKMRKTKTGVPAPAKQKALLGVYRAEALRRASETNSRPVRRLDTGEVFRTVTAAAEAFGCDKSSISAVARGKRRSVFGVEWEFV